MEEVRSVTSITAIRTNTVPRKLPAWFLESDDKSRPKATAEAPINKAPMYSQTITPASKAPNGARHRGTGTVSASIIASMVKAEKNLPSASSHSEKGMVSKSSTLPVFRSSAQLFIVSTGMTIIKTMGKHSKYVRRLAVFIVK